MRRRARRCTSSLRGFQTHLDTPQHRRVHPPLPVLVCYHFRERLLAGPEGLDAVGQVGVAAVPALVLVIELDTDSVDAGEGDQEVEGVV